MDEKQLDENSMVTITEALIALEVPEEHRATGARLRHALEAIIGRQPKRFRRKYSPEDGRIQVRLGAVQEWLVFYRPHVGRVNGEDRNYVQIYLRDDYKEILDKIAYSVGRPSLSAMVNDLAEGGLEIVIAEE